MGTYPVPYNSMPAVTPTPSDYTYQPPVHMVPTYYPPGQPAMQPPPVMYRVPTPPNTPTSSQVIARLLILILLINKMREKYYTMIQNKKSRINKIFVI